MDNQSQAATTPPSWTAFKKMGDVSEPSAAPPSDYAYTPPASSPIPGPSSPPALAPSVPASSAADEKKNGIGFGGIKSLLGLSKDDSINVVPIQPSPPTEVLEDKPVVSRSSYDQAPVPPITADLGKDVSTSMSIPGFIPDRTPAQEHAASSLSTPAVSTPTDTFPTKEFGPVSNIPSEASTNSPPVSVTSEEVAASSFPKDSTNQVPVKSTAALPQSPERESASVTVQLAPSGPTSADAALFSPLSITQTEAPSLLESPPQQPPPNLPFPSANLPSFVTPPRFSATPTPVPILTKGTSVSVDPSLGSPQAGSTSSLPTLDQQKEALKQRLANIATPMPAVSQPAPPVSTAVPPSQSVASEHLSPSPPASALAPDSIQAAPVSIVSNPVPPQVVFQPQPIATPNLPLPTQASPEPPPLAAQSTPVTSQQVLQAPEFAPETSEPVAASTPPLDNYPPSPQPAAPSQTQADLGGFLGAPPVSEHASAVNFPGSQSPPSVVSSTAGSSGGLRSIGDVDSSFNLLANPPGGPNNPPYLAPVDQAFQQQQPTPQAVASANKRSPIWPIVGGVALALVLIGVVAYFLISRLSGSGSPNPSTLGAATNQAIIAAALGPDSWENNYSNSLLPIERGGLELAITDPASPSISTTNSAIPATASVAPLVATKSSVGSLVLTFARAEVHLNTQTVIANPGNISATQSAQKVIDRWETLRLEKTDPINLMDLRRRGGSVDSLGVTYLAAGHYAEMRLYVTSAVLTTISGEVYTLNVTPANGIIKIAKPFDVSSTGTLKLTVDLDAPLSVSGSGGNYNFEPVVAHFLIDGQSF
jgi:Domain of unknown function (DUF4382)